MEQKQCKNCGEPFTPNRGNQKYCSKGCREDFYATKHYGDGVSVKGKTVTVSGALNVLKFYMGL